MQRQFEVSLKLSWLWLGGFCQSIRKKWYHWLSRNHSREWLIQFRQWYVSLRHCKKHYRIQRSTLLKIIPFEIAEEPEWGNSSQYNIRYQESWCNTGKRIRYRIIVYTKSCLIISNTSIADGHNNVYSRAQIVSY